MDWVYIKAPGEKVGDVKLTDNRGYQYIDPFLELDNVGVVSFKGRGEVWHEVSILLAIAALPEIRKIIPPMAQFFEFRMCCHPVQWAD